MKTLKSFLEVYKPKAGDEQKFVDKHVTIKHQDRNEVNGKSNGDDVFNASNVKTVNRKANRQGHDVGEDEKVYEEVEDLEELSHKTLQSYKSKSENEVLKMANNLRKKEAKNVDTTKLKNRADGIKTARSKLKNEAAPDHDIDTLLDEALAIIEKTLTPAELKKREEIAQAMERENPGMPMAKKMAIATAQAKKVAEEVEQIDLDESAAKVADHLIKRYGDNVRKSHVLSAAGDFGVSASKLSKAVRTKLGKNMLGEEVEQIDEGKTPALNAVLSGNVGQKYGQVFAKHGDKIHGMMQAVKKERGDVVKAAGGSSRAAMHHDLALKAYDSWKKNTNEEVEQIDELSKKTLASYAKKAAYQASSKGVTGGLQLSRGSHNGDSEEEKKGIKNVSLAYKRSTGARKAIERLAKEDIINRAVDKYVPEELKYTAEQRLINRIHELPESHINTIVDLFHSLSEDNQRVMIESVETTEGLNKVLDFAISNRGA